MERVGGKLGKTASDRGGDWFSQTRDGRHRVWRSACHGCWRPVILVKAGLCWRVMVNPSQSVTAVTLKLDNSVLVSFFGSSPVLLPLSRRVPLKCNLKLQVAQSHKKETYLCSRTPPRDFNAQSHKKETSMLNHNWKRLLNNYKELNKVLNTWYTIRGIHNTVRNKTDSVFLDT